MDSSMDFGEPYNDLYHDDIMKAISMFPSLDTPAFPLTLMNSDINSETECDLPDNEQAVDLIKYLDCQDGDDIKEEIIFHEHDAVTYFSSEHTGSKALDEEFGPTLASWNRRYDSSSKILPSDLFASPDKQIFHHSPKKQKMWYHSPDKPSWMRPYVKQEPEALDPFFSVKLEPEVPSDPFIIGSWTPEKLIIKEESHDFLPICPWQPHYDPEIYPQVPHILDTGTEVASSDESDVDIETVPDATWSTDIFDQSTSVASTSTERQKKPVYSARVISMPKPVGRPRGSKKQTAAVKSSTSQNTLQPSCSRSATPAAGRGVVQGQKRKPAKCETVTAAQSQPTYTQAFSSSYSVNFHDYAMSPLSSAAATAAVDTARPTVPTRRVYRRNTSLDNVDLDKQNHHNQLERNRRQKLADLFNALRENVLSIAGNPKASKVFILEEATRQIKGQKEELVLQNHALLREERRQMLLSNKLRRLRAKICRRVK